MLDEKIWGTIGEKSAKQIKNNKRLTYCTINCSSIQVAEEYINGSENYLYNKIILQQITFLKKRL